MKKEKKIHEGYFKLKASGSNLQLFGEYQYFYSSEKGEISLIELKNYFGDGKDLWEIYSLKGDLFEDVERFESQEEAEDVIKKYFNQ